jgi:hypothetical protein
MPCQGFNLQHLENGHPVSVEAAKGDKHALSTWDAQHFIPLSTTCSLYFVLPAPPARNSKNLDAKRAQLARDIAMAAKLQF